jgi:hypothetical protein
MNLAKCVGCETNLTKDNSKLCCKVEIGRDTFLVLECGKCFSLTKVKTKEGGR